MTACIAKSKDLKRAVKFVQKSHQMKIGRYIAVHRGMMVCFLFGYLIVLVSFIFNFIMISEFFISIILFLGAVFVLIGISTQTYLLSEIQNTLQGILPICSVCKKIRNDGEDPKNPNSWRRLEEYIKGKSNADFSHGICPECIKNLYPDIEFEK